MPPEGVASLGPSAAGGAAPAVLLVSLPCSVPVLDSPAAAPELASEDALVLEPALAASPPLLVDDASPAVLVLVLVAVASPPSASPACRVVERAAAALP